jgi:hypothetical protein
MIVKRNQKKEKLNNWKLENNRRQAAQKKEHRISRSVETSGK